MRTPIFVISAMCLAACGGSAKKSSTQAPVTGAPTKDTPKPAAGDQAMAMLEPRSGSEISGMAMFKEVEGGVQIELEIKGAKPGKHGAHLHETGDCSAADAKSAGGHFNPDKMDHGAPEAMPHHGGDLGNIEVGADGTGKLMLEVKGLTVKAGEHSVVGRAVIVHADEDDLKSQPAGNAGARAACGVVKAGGM
jgi:Cu-Zn family superoxide dismutase